MDEMTEAEFQEMLAIRLISKIVKEEAHFVATVKVGDRVQWTAWVWDREITGNPLDPKHSAQVTFTGTVEEIDRDAGMLRVDMCSVTPGAAEVRQRPRYHLPITAFEFAETEST